MKNKKGFTLIELVIVVIIVAILTVISGVIYKNHVRKAKMVEGKTLLNTIADSQDVYYSENEIYYSTQGNSFYNTDSTLMIDARPNKYFRQFRTENKTTYALIITKDTEGKITMTMTLSSKGAPTISIKDTGNN